MENVKKKDETVKLTNFTRNYVSVLFPQQRYSNNIVDLEFQHG